ncbi:MAG: sugar transferase, partial [Nitrospirota bacterium]
MIRVGGTVIKRRILWMVFGDIFIFSAVPALAALFRLGPAGATSYIEGHVFIFTLFLLAFFTCFIIADLYDIKKDFRRAQHLLHVLAACVVAMFISAVFFYSAMSYLGRSIFAVSGVLIFLSASLTRSLGTSLCSTEHWQKRVLIVGAGKTGKRLSDIVRQYPSCGMNILGFIGDSSKAEKVIGEKPILGNYNELIEAVERLHVDIVAVCVMDRKSDDMLRNLIRCHYSHITVMDMPSIFEAITGKLSLEHISNEWLLHYVMSSDRGSYWKTKRLLDITFSLVLLTLSSPLCLLAIAMIKLDSKGGIFFRQERVGMNFKKFNIIKFRTMMHDADNGNGPTPAVKNDPRVTRVGNILRKFRIDEIPQLINVLIGDMSFVGP